ncbi:hypothetical protein, partial [Sandarakinorhabdus cyanobacteriorum]|uniref:hypothetical protein n=1 Tax=Sandarakinorhabdus cyanobacteriorum TaxID=1981098 RepID=UPI001A9CB298
SGRYWRGVFGGAQLFGRYGGLDGIDILSENRVEVHLAFTVPDVGTALHINTKAPMSAEFLSALRHLQSLLRNAT